jgi:DNA-binding MarR family transcriptional regulator
MPSSRRTPARSVTRATPAAAHPGAWASPGFLLWHGTLRWQRHVGRALESLGLTYTQFTLLAGVWWLAREHGDDPSQRELADHGGIDAVMTSKVIRTLEERGLVDRVADPADQRIRRLRLTRAGRALAERAVTVVDRADAEFFQPVAARDAVVAVLRGIARRAEDGRVTEPEAPTPARPPRMPRTDPSP